MTKSGGQLALASPTPKFWKGLVPHDLRPCLYLLLAVVNQGIRAAMLYSNKILQFLTGSSI